MGVGSSLLARSPGPKAPPRSAVETRRPEPAEEPRLDARPLDLGLCTWLWTFTRPHKALRTRLLTAVVLRSVQLPLLAWATGAIIEGPIARGQGRALAAGVAGYFLLSAFTQFTLHFRQRYALELGEAVVHDVRLAVFRHLQSLPLGYFHRTRLGGILSAVSSDAESVRVGVQDVLFTSLVGMGQMTIASAFMLRCDPVLFAILALLGPLLWFLNQRFRRELSQAHRMVRESFSRLTGNLAESIGGIRVTQSFAREELNSARFRAQVEMHARNNLRVTRVAGLFGPLLDFNSQLFLALLVVIGGGRVLSGASEVGSLIQFVFLAGVFFQPIQILAEQYNQALTAMAGAERLRKLLETRPDWSDPPDARKLPCLAGRVEFIDVSFAYQPPRNVLEHVSLTAEPGQSIALVGHTGSGKSTLVNLVCKFYLPTRGQILIDGRPLTESDTTSYRWQLGIVTQQNYLFAGTVFDNIRFARPQASDEEVVAAVEGLDALDLLERLPRGFCTEVGEQGAGLSQGQRQLVCFARAMLADPRILILDEATSSVDVFTEARLQRAVARLLVGRTSFVVAHRLSTIRHADVLLVLEQGRIVERGSHRELLERNGTYARLYAEFVRTSAA